MVPAPEHAVHTLTLNLHLGTRTTCILTGHMHTVNAARVGHKRGVPMGRTGQQGAVQAHLHVTPHQRMCTQPLYGRDTLLQSLTICGLNHRNPLQLPVSFLLALHPRST